MGEITLRNLDDATLSELRRRATRHGWTVEDELCSIVSQAVRPTRDDVLRRVDELRESIARRERPSTSPPAPDAVDILREIREP